MKHDHYPEGTVESLLQTDLVTLPTRRVIEKRLEQKTITTPCFFSDKSFITLHIVCDRLIPQERENPVDIAGVLDDFLAENKGNGWRYDSMPPDQEAFTLGLLGIDQTSQLLFKKHFHEIGIIHQEEILHSIQSGNVEGNVWQQLSSSLFFEELLAAVVEIYYSHPAARDEIGEVSMADAMGWKKIGLNEREAQEPEPLNDDE